MGDLRLDTDGALTEVSLRLLPAARARGVGTTALALGLEIADRAPYPRMEIARIVDGNEASIALFRRAGFTAGPSHPTDGWTLYVRYVPERS